MIQCKMRFMYISAIGINGGEIYEKAQAGSLKNTRDSACSFAFNRHIAAVHSIERQSIGRIPKCDGVCVKR